VKPIPTPTNVPMHLRAMHDRLNDGWARADDAWWTSEAATLIESMSLDARAMKSELDKAIQERDRARAWWCMNMESQSELNGHRKSRRQFAEENGWDLFGARASSSGPTSTPEELAARLQAIRKAGPRAAINGGVA
jgi:hypothetical protein